MPTSTKKDMDEITLNLDNFFKLLKTLKIYDYRSLNLNGDLVTYYGKVKERSLRIIGQRYTRKQTFKKGGIFVPVEYLDPRDYEVS